MAPAELLQLGVRNSDAHVKHGDRLGETAQANHQPEGCAFVPIYRVAEEAEDGLGEENTGSPTK